MHNIECTYLGLDSYTPVKWCCVNETQSQYSFLVLFDKV